MPLNLSPTQIAFNARGDGTFHRPFAEQVEFLRSKLDLPTEHWDDILKQAHDRGFVVAGALKADLLTDFHAAVLKTAAEGKSLQWFKKEFENIVAKNGWQGWTGEDTPQGRDWRARVIYRTNLTTSHAAGRYAQLTDPELLKVRPFWKYVHNDTVQHPRELHQAWGRKPVVLRHDDPWWQTHYPPNGWGCRCRAVAVRPEEYPGDPPPQDGEWIKFDRNKKPHVLPKGVEYGWDYAPGASRAEELRQLVADKAAKLPGPIAKAFSQAMQPAMTPVYWDKTLPQAAWHDSSFAGAPVEFKQAIQRHDSQMAGIRPHEPGENPYYWRADRRIHMQDLKPDSRKAQGTWRHEYGHFLDHQTGPGGYVYRSSQDDFTKLMQSETRELVKASGYGPKGAATDAIRVARTESIQKAKKAVTALDKEARSAYLEDQAKRIGLKFDDVARFLAEDTIHDAQYLAAQVRANMMMDAIQRRDPVAFMDALHEGLFPQEKDTQYARGLIGKFSDLVGSASRNKILGHGPSGNGGHSDGYYKKDSSRAATEVFANLTALLGSDSPFWHQVTRAFYPSLADLYMRIIQP